MYCAPATPRGEGTRRARRRAARVQVESGNKTARGTTATTTATPARARLPLCLGEHGGLPDRVGLLGVGVLLRRALEERLARGRVARVGRDDARGEEEERGRDAVRDD